MADDFVPNRLETRRGCPTDSHQTQWPDLTKPLVDCLLETLVTHYCREPLFHHAKRKYCDGLLTFFKAQLGHSQIRQVH